MNQLDHSFLEGLLSPLLDQALPAFLYRLLESYPGCIHAGLLAHPEQFGTTAEADKIQSGIDTAGKKVLGCRGTVIVGSDNQRLATGLEQPAGYERVEFAIAPGDAAILETRYVARAAEAPFKVIVFPRASLHEEAGFSVPRRIEVANLRKHTETEVTVDELELNPVLDMRLFTTNALLREAELTSRRPAAAK